MRSTSSNHVPTCVQQINANNCNSNNIVSQTSSSSSSNMIQHQQQPLQPAATTSEDYLNKKITFIQNHINNLLIEITNLPEPWSYAVTEDGRVFFIK